MTPFYERNGITIYCGDCLEVMPQLSGIDAVITDPPYSSGGQFRGDRMASVVNKYVQTDSLNTWKEPFTGDNRDQRGFLVWCSMWMGSARRITNNDGVFVCFTDWRQLPTITDAMQCGGWVWRGITTWWKPGIRMQRGRFSLSAEYCAIGSNGGWQEGEHSPQNVFSFAPVGGSEKNHIAEKPIEVFSWVISVTKKDAAILDPFMGSGTALVAAQVRGRRAIGIELSEEYCKIAVDRLGQSSFFSVPANHGIQPTGEVSRLAQGSFLSE